MLALGAWPPASEPPLLPPLLTWTPPAPEAAPPTPPSTPAPAVPTWAPPRGGATSVCGWLSGWIRTAARGKGNEQDGASGVGERSASSWRSNRKQRKHHRFHFGLWRVLGAGTAHGVRRSAALSLGIARLIAATKVHCSLRHCFGLHANLGTDRCASNLRTGITSPDGALESPPSAQLARDPIRNPNEAQAALCPPQQPYP